MELLIIKSGKDYVRVKGGDYILCNLDKASVFPMDKLDIVKDHLKRLRTGNFASLSINRLTISEEPFNDPEL
jgi:hypothetical protein